MIRLANKWLELEISPKGAEICSIKGLRTGKEYLWKGDPALWNRHSPLLFPIVGRLNKDTAYIDGRKYKIPKHGFLSDAKFETKLLEPHMVVLYFDSSARMHSMFPFPFHIEVMYKLRSNHLEVLWRLRNTGISPMPFQIGGHPGLNYPNNSSHMRVKAYLSFRGRKNLESASVAESGCLAQRRYALPMEDIYLPITDELFNNDSVIIDRNQVDTVALLDLNKKPYVTLETQAPVILLWSPYRQDAPFICIEPWYGLPDYDGYEGDFEMRPYTNRVNPGHQAAMGYMLRMDAEVLPNALSRKNKFYKP